METYKCIQISYVQIRQKTLETIYFSFIRPTLEYADIVWDNCNMNEKYKLEQIQYEAAMIVTGATRSCSRAKLIEETGWLSLEKRRYNHRIFTFYKMLKNNVPTYFKDLLPPTVHQVSQRNLRSGHKLQPPRCNTNLYQNSFRIQTINDWNALPDNIKLINSNAEFKRYLYKDARVIPPYFYSGERRCQILHTRLRLGCSTLNSDLFKNHLRDNDSCACGSPETAEHFLCICSNYDNIRRTTLQQIQVPFNTNILLCGCPLYDNQTNGEIFDFVHKFIINSRRFDN